MYLRHFGLREFPFATTPDPRFYYPSAKHREALACLLYTVQQRKGFALITGEVGAGKTMLCQAALKRFGQNVRCAVITHPSLSAKQFFQAMIAEFDLVSRGPTMLDMLHTLRDFLSDCQRQVVTAVLVVDEAQNLSYTVLEEIRLLGNLQTHTAKLLQVVLVGQPELRRLIGTHRLRQLDQRITVKFHLGTLSLQDVHSYIEHRLQVAGAAEPIFDAAARTAVARASDGAPRVVNVICDQALLQAYINDEHEIGADAIRRVVTEREGYYMDAPVPQPEGMTE